MKLYTSGQLKILNPKCHIFLIAIYLACKNTEIILIPVMV